MFGVMPQVYCKGYKGLDLAMGCQLLVLVCLEVLSSVETFQGHIESSGDGSPGVGTEVYS